jgi:hypothetical protein
MIGLRQVLVSHSAVYAIAQDRISNGLIPQDYARPYIVFDIISEIGESTLACKPGSDDVHPSVRCYSKDAKEARMLAEAARDAIEDAYTTEVVLRQLPFEKDTKLFSWALDFNSIEYR